ncbi:SepM family pheromone-processing serine protease [Metabacillus herbersteinensis]|uniref:endopeptidase La n=1 Tax=Metabacillus herbersteinensis TaxID=283816 RepID=A0ABV6GBX2_9BACI
MRNKTIIRSLIILTIVAAVLTFIKLPYYITQPGMATELAPIVEVENGYDERGSFSLTTVRFGRANPLTYLWAQFNEFYYIHPLEEIRGEDESDEEYLNRQLHMMETSQESAITVAYKKAGKEVDYKFHGVYVLNVLKDMPAAGKLEAGDRIYKVNDQEFETSDEFIEYVSGIKVGKDVLISFERNGDEKETAVKLAPFPEDPNKSGIGISLLTDREIIVEPEITLNTEKIGGPSAGLMMTLEIYNQLTKEDLTKGYKIAGTGTIATNGEVGPIGGISQKIVAADNAGVDIFLAPNEKDIPTSNYNEAVKTAEKINATMKIVPVDTFEEAVVYLTDLDEKR